MPTDVKITTELLLQGTLLFALIDGIYVPLLAWRLRRDFFLRLKWPLAAAAALVWYGIWAWAIGNFWETVYAYVFPAWARTWTPFIALVGAALAGLGLWVLAARLKGNPVLSFCLLGGSLGTLTHIWAVYRGVVSKPPMLQGASPLAAVVFAFFEYMLYWCIILTLAAVPTWAVGLLRKPQPAT